MIRKLKAKYQAAKLKRAQKREEKRQLYHQILNAPSAYDDAILSWIAPETIKHERGTMWKILVTLILGSLVAWSIYTDSWTFTLAIIIFIFVYYLAHLEHPKQVEIKISEIGIKVGGRKYTYNRIKAFWIIYEPPFVKTLSIRVAGEIISEITIQLDGQNPSEVREVLISKIPELEGQTEKLSDIFLRIFKI